MKLNKKHKNDKSWYGVGTIIALHLKTNELYLFDQIIEGLSCERFDLNWERLEINGYEILGEL